MTVIDERPEADEDRGPGTSGESSVPAEPSESAASAESASAGGEPEHDVTETGADEPEADAADEVEDGADAEPEASVAEEVEEDAADEPEGDADAESVDEAADEPEPDVADALEGDAGADEPGLVRPAESAESAEEPSAATGPRPRTGQQRRAEEPGALEVEPPVVRASAKFVRSAPRKARLVVDHIRGKDVEEALAILQFTPRAAARDVEKLVRSAMANAESNHELVGEELRIVDIRVDEGPTLKRFRPRAMGRATRINKRTCHMTVALAPKPGEW